MNCLPCYYQDTKCPEDICKIYTILYAKRMYYLKELTFPAMEQRLKESWKIAEHDSCFQRLCEMFSRAEVP